MPISPESQYCLQGGYESLDYVCDVHAAAYRIPVDVDRLVDRDEPIAPAIKRAFDEWYPTADPFLKAELAFEASFQSGLQIEIAIESVVLGFLMSDKPLSRDLMATAWTRWDGWRNEFQAMLQRIAVAVSATRVRDFLEWYHDQRRPTLTGCATLDSAAAWRSSSTRSSVVRRRERRARGILRRSLSLARDTVGESGIRAFVSGSGLVIEGARYSYRVERLKRISLLRESLFPGCGTPYNLTIVRKADGVPLATACVYFEDTPPFDQIVALALYVRDYEDESELLRRANISPLPKFVQEFAEFDDRRQWSVTTVPVELPHGVDTQIAAITIPILPPRDERWHDIERMVVDTFYDMLPSWRDAITYMRQTTLTFDRFVLMDPATASSLDGWRT